MRRKSSDPDDSPATWGAMAAEFVSARLALVRLEARAAREVAARRFASLLLLLLCGALTWILGMVGLIGWIAAICPWNWWQVTLATAGIHALGAVLAGLALRRPAPPVFPLTRAELANDQQWLETLKRKS
jgi:uncharacterized membrane protein YqjE